MSDFLQLLERTNELMDDPGFQEDAQEYLDSGDRNSYDELIKNKVYKVIEENEYIQRCLMDNGHLASSFQYVSPNFGDFLRCRYPHKSPFSAGGSGFNLSAVEAANIENLRTVRVAQRELNLLFCDDLIAPLQVQFGGDTKVTTEYITFHIPHKMWVKMEKDLRGVNNDENFIEIIVGKNINKLKELVMEQEYLEFVKGFRNHLMNNSLVVKEDLRRLNIKDDIILFRIFLLTYCYSIMHQKNLGSEPNQHFSIIIPINLTTFPTKHFLNKVSTYCGAFEKPLSKDLLHSIEYSFRQISTKLLELEWLSIKTPRRINVAVVENLIRLCSEIHDRPPVEVTRCKDVLKKILTNHPSNNSKGFHFIEQEIDKIYNNFITVDPDMLELLKRIENIIPDDEKEGIIFFFSEPGGGKDTLAQLCHLISPRSWKKKTIQEQINVHKKELKGQYENYKKFYEVSGFLEPQVNSFFENDLELAEGWKKNRMKFNYRTLNCSQATEDILWGDNDEPGEFIKAHLLFGTLFLDEVDKLKKGLDNQLLRVLEDPREVYPKKGVKPIPIKLLLVFASNVPLERLEREGFSSAFISRLGRNYFPVPPLRERKEDIPLLVNHFIRLENEERLKKIKDREEKDQFRSKRFIRYFDVKGLKLLMNLKWEYNLRALKSFLC